MASTNRSCNVLRCGINEWCYCPCVKRKLGTWRKSVDVDDERLDFDSCQAKAKFVSNQLVNHLEKKMELQGECGVLHTLAHTYITHVYENYTLVDGTNRWLHHRALYNVGDKLYQEAAAAETQHILKYVL